MIGQKLSATDGKQVKVTLQQMRMAAVHTTMELLVIEVSLNANFTTGDNSWYYAQCQGRLVVGEQSTAKTFTLTKLVSR